MARSCALTIVAAAWLAAPSVASGATPAPAWSIVVSSYPTHFASGTIGSQEDPPGYLLLVTNSGGAATDGEFTITDSLPARLSFTSAAGASGFYGSQKTALACAVAVRTVTCTGGKPVLQPGETATVTVPVEVKAGSSSTVLDKATVSGGGAAAVATSTSTPMDGESAAFDFLPGASGLDGGISAADGTDATLAGSHPYRFHAGINFPTFESSGGLFAVGGGVRDLHFAFPPGLVVNPGAAPERCTDPELRSSSGCPAAAQVGTVALVLSVSNGAPTVETAGLYVMVPPPGVAVEFGASVTEGTSLHLLGRLSRDGSYGLSAEANDLIAKVPIFGADVTLWGEPSDSSHDSLRGHCISSGGLCPTERTNAALLTMPGFCGQGLLTTASADSWLEPGVFSTRSIESPAVSGCNSLAFTPSLSARPTTAVSDSPTGLDIDLHLPQSNDYEGRAQAAVRDAQVRLPEGLTVNPAVAGGLAACTAAELAQAACPEKAKIGTAEIDTPILGAPLSGGVYLAKPDENPFGALLALYVAIDDPATGIVLNLPARVDSDPLTGRLTLRLDDLPQLPIEDVRLSLFEGARAVLKTPLGCGTHTTTSQLTPWSSPEGVDATPADSFGTSVPVTVGTCPAGEADAPSRPSYWAGSVEPKAGAFSSFLLRVSREDGTQRLSAIDTTLPAGVVAKLAGVPTCSEAEIAVGHCMAASQVGSVGITAGAGPSPLPLTGAAYLAGPYNGAPLSLAVVVHALAGPFDLGTVAVRVALYIDPRSAQIHAVSDPLPTILRGIPLDIRELRLDLDRPDFVRNPTSCDPMAVTGMATTSLGQVAPLSDRFQVGDCEALTFKPRLSVALSGAVGRGGHPAVRAVYRGDPAGAAASGIAFKLPAGELLDLHHLGRLCPRDLEAARCPRSSRLGSLRIDTPMLDAPLEGSVHLRVPSGRLPGLSAEVRSGGLRFLLRGRVTGRGGRLGISLETLPDVPLSKAVLSLPGGRRGLVVNSESLCAGSPGTATASFSAHSGKQRSLRVPVRLGDGC